MKFLIFNNQIAGRHYGGTVPQGFTVAEGVLDEPEELLYFNPATNRVEQKPLPPSPAHQWNDIDKQYQEPIVPALPEEVPQENSPAAPSPERTKWVALLTALEESPLRTKIAAAATTLSKAGMVANLSYTTLMAIVTSSHNRDRLFAEIANLRGAMRQISTVGDFSAEELAQFRQILTDAGFELGDELTV